jgi:hypothetical protein
MSKKIDIHKNLKINMGASHEDPNIFTMLSRSLSLKMRNIVDNICRQRQNARLRPMFFLKNIVPVIRQCKVFSRAEQTTNDNMAHANCVPDT